MVSTRAPVSMGETPFKPGTTTVFPSAKVPACLLSISVPRKPSTVTTDYIHPRLDIVGS